ncbi:hypothetical protein PMAYCL1PPCAC_20477, partial [Pristionchus mayeri]
NIDRIVDFVGYENGVVTLVGEVKLNETTRRFLATVVLPKIYIHKISPKKNITKFVKTFNELTLGKLKKNSDGETIQDYEKTKDEVFGCDDFKYIKKPLEFLLLVEREMKSISIMEKNTLDYDPNKSGGIEHCRLYLHTFD